MPRDKYGNVKHSADKTKPVSMAQGKRSEEKQKTHVFLWFGWTNPFTQMYALTYTRKYTYPYPIYFQQAEVAVQQCELSIRSKFRRESQWKELIRRKCVCLKHIKTQETRVEP